MRTVNLQPRSVAHGFGGAAFEGVRDITPMVMGIVPFGLAIGAAIGASSLTSAEGLFSGPVILAGAAQLATIQMLDGGTTPVVVILSAVSINARILLYSASLARWFADRPLWQRLLLALPVIDQMHFTCAPRFERGDLDRSGRAAYYVGAAAWLVLAWVASQIAALLVGAGAPQALRLDLAAPLAMVGLLAKSATGRTPVVAAVTAGLVATVGVGLPLHGSVLVATLAGMLAGQASARVTPRVVEVSS